MTMIILDVMFSCVCHLTFQILGSLSLMCFDVCVYLPSPNKLPVKL